MFKVLISFAFVLWISGVICENCLFTDQTWGDIDPTKIIYCNSKTNEAEESSCRTGTGYIRNATLSGCVNWEDWNDDCILRKPVPEIKSCEGLESPLPVQGDPTRYYLCSSGSSEPVVLSCPKSRGFIAHEGYIGCLPWKTWRNKTGCNN